MGRVNSKKKSAPGISGRDEARIVELSLKNPGFGARRLLPLLNQEKISVTSSQIYTILKRHGLQTRAHRLAGLKEKTAKKTSAPQKRPVNILPEVEEQIVEVSLKNPKLGAKRLLPLLAVEGIEISASAVKTVLKRNGLENRDKRLARSREQSAAEALPEETLESLLLDPLETHPLPEEPEWGPEAVEPLIFDRAEEPEPGPGAIEPITAEPAAEPQDFAEVSEQKTAPPAAQPQPPAEIIAEQIKPMPAEAQRVPPEILDKTPPSHVPADVKAAKIAKSRGPWLLTLCNLVLLLLLGFLSFYAWQNIHRANLKAGPMAAIPKASASAPAKPEAAAPPLSSYRVITERDLFNVSKAEAPVAKKEIDIEKIDPANKDLGLKLMGTVVVENSNRSVAIIDNQKIRRQEAYREGDQANEVRIKKIMRNKVIIVTAEGDRLLTVDTENTATPSKTPGYGQKFPGGTAFPPQIPAQLPAGRTSSITLNRQEVASAVEDPEKLLAEVNIAPYVQNDQAAGFRLNRVPAKNILRKMGLRSRDVIVGVNGETISGPEQAEDFIRTLGQGGEVTITFKRRRRTRQLKLNID